MSLGQQLLISFLAIVWTVFVGFACRPEHEYNPCFVIPFIMGCLALVAWFFCVISQSIGALWK